MEINPEDHALSVENLNLTIDGNHILKNIDFSVGRGEFIAIVGKVGSGKSMLLLSLLGETRASFRKFQIGQNDAKKLNLSQLRQFFTYVPQEGFIMSASLRENVACDYEIGNLNDELISRSLARAQFELRLERLTEGLSTEIGERGVNLSGGQKQRISLARVDFFRSPIVVLDDCLSAVDVDTEKKILESLFKNSWKQRTRILVTHRLSVLNDVDRVIYLENGRVVAEGKYKDLLKKSESFREYAQSVARDSSQPQERGHA